MVAVPGIQGATVTVRVGGKDLIEHDHDSLKYDTHTVHRYIQSEAGKEFCVRLRLDANIRYKSDGMTCRVYIDGKFCECRIFRQSAHRRGGRVSFNFEGVLLCPHEKAFFRFGTLKTDEAAARLSTEEILSLGCIEVEVGHVKITGQAKQECSEKLKTEVTVQETALKGRAMSHAVEFARTERVTMPDHVTTTKEVSRPGIVRFYYRSRDDLQAAYIIPRTPSPEPLYARDIDSMTQDELKTMQARLRDFEQSATAARVKREPPGDDESSAFGHNKRQKTKTYLTLDDDGSYHEEPAPQPELSSAAESID